MNKQRPRTPTKRSLVTRTAYDRSFSVFLLFLTCLLAGLALLTSCGADKDTVTDVGQPGHILAPPLLPLPQLHSEPLLYSGNPMARDARAIVTGQRNMVSYVARSYLSAISMVNGHAWDSDRNCWIKELGDPERSGCSQVVRACSVRSGYDWSVTFNGSCPYGFGLVHYDDWNSLSGTSSMGGERGRIQLHNSGSTQVNHAWTWDLAPTFGGWSFYDGDIGDAHRIATWNWRVNADGSEDDEWSWVRNGKWESHTSEDGRTGSMIVHQWDEDAGFWRPWHEIRWDATNGTWKTYDVEGATIRDDRW